MCIFAPYVITTPQVYGATYLTANLTEAACHDMTIDSVAPTVLLTSLVNTAAIAWKDKKSAELYKQQAKQVSFPKISYSLFAMRDGITILSAFHIKHVVRQLLEVRFLDIYHFGKFARTPSKSYPMHGWFARRRRRRRRSDGHFAPHD